MSSARAAAPHAIAFPCGTATDGWATPCLQSARRTPGHPKLKEFQEGQNPLASQLDALDARAVHEGHEGEPAVAAGPATSGPPPIQKTEAFGSLPTAVIDRTFRVLFACVGNSARSQMAQGLARAWGGDRVDARSGGSRPLGRVLPEAIAAMREVGIDISGHKSQGFDEAWIRTADVVVTMGCGDDACPAFVGRRLEDWNLPDPAGHDLEAFRRVRDEIATRVRALLADHGIPRADTP